MSQQSSPDHRPDPHDPAAMHRLLRERFSASELRRFCLQSPRFQFLVDHFGPGFSKLDMIDAVLVECEDRDLLPALLAEVEVYQPPPPEEELPAGPPPFTVPFPRNARFVGREEELEALHRLLQGDRDATPVGITPAGISGMGGIGKTQLAVEYAYRYQDAYPGGIFWVNAARVQDWAGELVALADRAGLVPADPDSPDRTGQMVAALARYLQRRPRSLVIFDNVAGPRHLQTVRLGPGITPAELGGALLFTTRRRHLPAGLATLDVEILPRVASRQMILAARPKAGEDPALEQLCATLGDLPLALELAAAALRHRPRLSVSAYLENLGRLGADDLHDKARVSPDDLATYYYAASLTPALQAQWEALKDDNACLLLRAAAQLGEAELVPVARLGLLTGLRDDDDGLEEPLSDALRELEANALVEPIQEGEASAGRRLRLHPLVRDFAARQTPEADTSAFRKSLAANLAAAFEDIATLESHCARRDIDALQRDLLAALGLLGQTSKGFRAPRSLERHLRDLLRLLQREAHNLRGWDRERRPAFFAQQVGKRATELGLAALAGAAEARLARGTAPYLGLQWRASAESPALERTLTGHEGMVFDVAVTLDGQRAISTSDDRTVRVWDLATGQELARLAGHEAGVGAVVPMPDRRRVMSASSDGTLKIWDLASGAEIATLRGHTSFVNAVAVTADGRRTVSASADCTVKVWDTVSGNELRTLVGHWEPVNAVAVTADGRRVVSAASDCRLKVWDMESGDELATLRGHQDLVLSVALTPDGQRAVSGSRDQTLRVWDLASGEEQAILRGHGERVHSVAVTADGCSVVSGSADRTLRIWDLHSGAELAVLRGHDDDVHGVAITPDDQWAVSASRDRTLRVWDIASLLNPGRSSVREMATVRGHEAPVLFVETTKNARRAVSGSADWTVKTWDIRSGRALKTLRDHEFNNDCIAVTADGRRTVFPSANNTLSVWGKKEQRVLATLRGHESSVLAVAVTPDGRRAVSGSADWTLKVWDPESGNELATLVGHEGMVRTVAISADGQRIVSGAFDQTLRVWDVASPLDTRLERWQQRAVLLGHEGVVRAVAVAPDGQRAVSGSDDRTVRVWDTETGEELSAVALDGSLRCVALVPVKRRAFGILPAAAAITTLAGDSAGNVYCLRYVEPK